MIKGSSGELWGVTLEQSWHFNALLWTLESFDNSYVLYDIGCGAGDVSKCWNGEYVGLDLDWVIDNVSKIRNPNQKFLHFDATKDDIRNFKNHSKKSIFFMNAFLEICQDPIKILEKLIQANPDALIIHRQRIGDDSQSEWRQSYGQSTVYSSVIPENSIEEIAKKINANIKKYHLMDEWCSFVIAK